VKLSDHYGFSYQPETHQKLPNSLVFSCYLSTSCQTGLLVSGKRPARRLFGDVIL
jgi:hypothetical protein